MIFREGFWASSSYTQDSDENSSVPDATYVDAVPLAIPIHNSAPWYGKRSFIRALAKAEYAATLGGYSVQYRGSSMCRCCNKLNGSSEFQVPIGGGHEWRWPIGFSHYVDRHNVRPSQAFIDFILNCTTNVDSGENQQG